MADEGASGAGAGRAALLAGLFLASLALRPQLSVVGPVLPRIQDDLGISHGVAGLLSTIPVFCMGVFAPSALTLARWIGLRYALAVATAMIGAAGILRAIVPGAPAVLLLTIPVGVGVGLAGTLFPIAVKERFHSRAGFATGVYTTGILVGSAVGAAVAVPLARAGGSWQTPFLVLSGVVAVLAPLWLLLSGSLPAHARVDERPPKLPLRSRCGWWLLLVFALQGATFYGLNSWLADSYVERGWSEGSAGALVTVLNVTSLPGALLVLWGADRIGSRRLQLLWTSVAMTGGALGIVLEPGAGWAWATITGLTGGIIFSLLLLLPLDAAHEPGEVGAFAGMMLGGGYVLTAAAPFALGAVRDAAGSFTPALWVVVATSAFVAVAAAVTYPRDLRRPHRSAAAAPGYVGGS